MVLRGRTLILGLFTLVLIIAVLAYGALRDAAHMRFAIGVYAEPRTVAPATAGPGSAEIQGVQRLPMHQPLVVRIEKATAGRSGMQAVAFLLTQEGTPIFPPQVLSLGHDGDGQPTEATRFPGLTRVPTQGLLSVVVVRVPAATPAALSALAAATAGTGPVHLTYARLASAAAALSGHAEMVTTEVRAPGPTAGAPATP